MSKVNLLQTEWPGAAEYFKTRGSVLFLSYCRFWEKQGFVQQSLAKELAQLGVEVTWYDGSGWRPYRPTVEGEASLSVSQMPQVPLRRFSFISHWDRKAKSSFLNRQLKKMKGDPVIWVQAGIDEGVAADLPYVDVFSVFDDPYRHSPVGELCNKAKVVVCQNRTAKTTLDSMHGDKTYVLLPPVDMSEQAFGQGAEVFLPPGFPDRVMGYIGSFFPEGFDMDLFEDFIVSFPDWGFVMMGRTNAKGQQILRRWKHRYANFHYFPWVPRQQVASLWKKIKISLLFYRPYRAQDGAFPVKTLEGLKFGVPCIATEVPKTAELEGIFPRSKYGEELKQSVEKALSMSPEDLKALYSRFALEMDPKLHLSKVAQWLKQR